MRTIAHKCRFARLTARWAFASMVCVSLARAESGPSPTIQSAFAVILRSGDPEKLRDALDRGAWTEARDAHGNTALMLAAVYGNSACVKLLLGRGANPNAINAAGATPLMRAAHDFESVRALLENGANP